MDVRYVVTHKPGQLWRTGVDFREQPGIMEHVLHFKKLNDAGRLELGGPFLESDGGMMITAAGETLESIRAYAAEDPSVVSGLLTYDVKPWFVAMKKS